MGETRTKNAKRNIYSAIINKVISLVLPFLTRTVLIYKLGTLYLGLSSLFTSILQILSLTELGFGAAMVFSMYEPLANHDVKKVCALLELYRKIYRVIGGVIFGSGLICMLFLPYLISGNIPADINVYLLYGINLFNVTLSYFMYAYKSSILSATQRSDITNKIATFLTVLSNGLQIVALIFTKNYYIYCLVLPLITIINNLLVNYFTNKMFPEYKCLGDIPKKELKDIIKRVAGLFVNKVCGVFRNSFDSIILSSFMGLTVLGKYNNYYYIMNSISTFMLLITHSITASVGNSMIKEDKRKNYVDFRKINFVYMWITGLCTICFFCMYQPFMNFWVGKDMLFDDSIMVAFCIYFFTSKMGDISYTYRQAAGLWWQDRIRPIIEAIVNLTLNIIFVRNFGVVGVLLSTILCLIFINTIWGTKVLFNYYFEEEKQSAYFIRLLYFALATVIACGVSGLVCQYVLTGSEVINIIIRLGVAFCIGNITYVLFYFKLPEFKEAIELAVRIIKVR